MKKQRFQYKYNIMWFMMSKNRWIALFKLLWARRKLEKKMALSVSIASNQLHGDVIVWKTSRHTMMLEGEGSHTEACGYSLITTVSHEEPCRMTMFHCFSVSIACCKKIITMILFFNYQRLSILNRLIFNINTTLRFQIKIFIHP